MAAGERARVIDRIRSSLLLLAALAVGCDAGERSAHQPKEAWDTVGLAARVVPAEHAGGAATFARACASCHGDAALGSQLGPPLVHPIYRPSHHADAAFLLAVRRGVRAHHWTFGDMPAVPGLDDAEIGAITAYVRWLQREAGIR